MLDSVPGPLQAILLPLAGAALIVMLGHFLPNLIRRLLASAAALASLAALWALRSGGMAQIEIYWEPLNLFRMGPSLHPDGLALLVGLTLAGITAASVLGIQGSQPRRTIWHGLILVILAGCLVLAMASNLLTLVLGSALIDLALIAMIISSQNDTGRVIWRLVVPGAVSTLLLFYGALLMDIQVGHASLDAHDFPDQVLLLMGAAGLLRMLVFPLQPRGLDTPETAATLLMPMGAGIYLLARVQLLAPVLTEQPWMLAVGGAALLAGGLFAWTGGLRAESPSRSHAERIGSDWTGFVVHQTGYALAFALLLGRSVPWPLLSLTLALTMLAIWWDVNLDPRRQTSARWTEWLARRLGSWWKREGPSTSEHVPVWERWRSSWANRHGPTLLLTIALASLAGAPLTAGAMGRWSFYASLLHRREATFLLITLIADSLLTAGLWIAIGNIWKRTIAHQPSATSLLSIVVLSILIVLLGIAPNGLVESVGGNRVAAPEVSVWGLGLIFMLPWLVGGWLARIGSRLENYAGLARSIVDLGWLYGGASWLARHLAGAVGWLGQVGEGEGWWGWALIILALGAMLLNIR
jgi:hypothetical protein